MRISKDVDTSPDEFEGLARPHLEADYRLAVAMLGRPDEAEDAVQDAVVLAWRRIAQLRDQDGFRPWFLAIVANRCRMIRRSRWWTVLRLAEITPPALPAEDGLAARLDLHQALRRLGAEDRAALVLFYALDLPLAEVAAALGISLSSAKARTDRAVGRIRARRLRDERRRPANPAPAVHGAARRAGRARLRRLSAGKGARGPAERRRALSAPRRRRLWPS